MNTDPSQSIVELANRLGTTPRRVLIAAARMAESPDHSAHELWLKLRREGKRDHALEHDSAALLLTSPASFSHNELASALQLLWKVSD